MYFILFMVCRAPTLFFFVLKLGMEAQRMVMQQETLDPCYRRKSRVHVFVDEKAEWHQYMRQIRKRYAQRCKRRDRIQRLMQRGLSRQKGS